MKKLLLLAAILLPLCAPTLTGGNIPKSKITSLIAECQHYEGVEVVQLGSLATMALKATVRLAASDEPDVREALKLISGIKRISVIDYENCESITRDKIGRKLDRLLAGGDLLMETRDGNEVMQIYGVVDEENGTVKDFIMHNPSGATLICIFGSIPVEKIARLATQDD